MWVSYAFDTQGQNVLLQNLASKKPEIEMWYKKHSLDSCYGTFKESKINHDTSQNLIREV